MTVSAICTQNAEHYTWGDNCDGWHLVKTPQLSVIQERMPSGTHEAKHFHHHAEQFFYVLEGIATMRCGEQSFELGPNQGIHIPAGKLHQLANCHDQVLIFTVTSTPPSHGDRVNATASS